MKAAPTVGKEPGIISQHEEILPCECMQVQVSLCSRKDQAGLSRQLSAGLLQTVPPFPGEPGTSLTPLREDDNYSEENRHSGVPLQKMVEIPPPTLPKSC